MSGAFQVMAVEPDSAAFAEVLKLADAVLDQRRHIVSVIETAADDCVLGAFDGTRCIGFLRFFVQVVGAEEGRPPVVVDGSALTEGHVEALGVATDARRDESALPCRTAPWRFAVGLGATRCARGVLCPAARTTR